MHANALHFLKTQLQCNKKVISKNLGEISKREFRNLFSHVNQF